MWEISGGVSSLSKRRIKQPEARRTRQAQDLIIYPYVQMTMEKAKERVRKEEEEGVKGGNESFLKDVRGSEITGEV